MRFLPFLVLYLLGVPPQGLAAQQPRPETAPWSHLIWGKGIGLAGMSATRNGSHIKLAVAASAEQYGNRYWLLARYDPKAKVLRRIWGSPIYSFQGAVTFLQSGTILDPKTPQVLVGCHDGRMEVWDLKTRTRILSIKTTSSPIRGMAVVDRLGTGVCEILIAEAKKVHLFDRKGVRRYTWSGMGGNIHVGNVDLDA